MRYRKLSAPGTTSPTDPGGDMTFGQGQANFYINQPEAVGQLVWTRLRLWTGQWFLSPQAGTAWKTKILGRYTGATADPTIQTRILSTTGVTDIAGYSSSLNRDSRAWSVNAQVNTQYGPVTIAGPA